LGGFIGFDLWHPDAVPGSGAGPVGLDRPWDPAGPNVNTPQGPTYHEPPKDANYSAQDGPRYIPPLEHKAESHTQPPTPPEEPLVPEYSPDAGVPIVDPEFSPGDQPGDASKSNTSDGVHPHSPTTTPGQQTEMGSPNQPASPSVAPDQANSTSNAGVGHHGELGPGMTGMTGDTGQTVAVPIFNPGAATSVDHPGDSSGSNVSDTSQSPLPSANAHQKPDPGGTSGGDSASPGAHSYSTDHGAHASSNAGDGYDGGAASGVTGMTGGMGQTVAVPIFNPEAPAPIDPAADTSASNLGGHPGSDALTGDMGVGNLGGAGSSFGSAADAGSANAASGEHG
jgi:hypothetical protein